MQDFSIAFSRVSRAAIAANPELKAQVTDFVARAYYNIHALPLSVAEPQWANAIVAAALQLSLDARVQGMSGRELIHLFENVIRISEEHLREAKRHAAMAANVFYLKETSLDAALVDNRTSPSHNAASSVLGAAVAHSGRLHKADSDA
ncbi:MAG: hypothetical protein ACKVOE_03850 [Rickettsiales bacterium]